MSVARSEAEMSPHHPETVREKADHLFSDFSNEIKVEIDEIRHGEAPAQDSQADLFVRKHVMGLILILFGLVALILLIGIAFVAFYGHHGGHTPGMF